jgi:hypothetical protein
VLSRRCAQARCAGRSQSRTRFAWRRSGA